MKFVFIKSMYFHIPVARNRLFLNFFSHSIQIFLMSFYNERLLMKIIISRTHTAIKSNADKKENIFHCNIDSKINTSLTLSISDNRSFRQLQAESPWIRLKILFQLPDLEVWLDQNGQVRLKAMPNGSRNPSAKSHPLDPNLFHQPQCYPWMGKWLIMGNLKEQFLRIEPHQNGGGPQRGMSWKTTLHL